MSRSRADNDPKPLVLLTRGSALALWQAHRVRDLLAGRGHAAEIRVVRTEGDRDRTTPLAAMGGTGVFTKELQRLLLAGEGDLAVHSLKDLPSAPVEGLVLAAVPERGPIEDVLVTRQGLELEALPPGSRIGTSSPRRRAFLRSRRQDLEMVELRGNVGTRLGRVESGELDAVVLARAGLFRLGLIGPGVRPLDPAWMVPAPCQGILGVETASGTRGERVVAALDDPAVRRVASAERAFMRTLAAGCSTPVGALAVIEGSGVTLRVRLARTDSGPWHDHMERGDDPVDVGRRAAEALLAADRRVPGGREAVP